MAIGQSNDFLQASDQDTLEQDSFELEGLDQEQDEEQEGQTDFFSATPEDTISESQETESGATDFLNAIGSQEEEPQEQMDFFNATPEDRKVKTAAEVGKQAQNEIFREMGIDPEDVPETRLQSNLNYFIQALGDVVEGGLKATSGFLDTIGGGEVKPKKDEKGNIVGFEQDINPEDGLLYKAGEWVGNQLKETFPDNPKFRDEFLSKLSRGAGSLASQFGLAAATRGRSLLTQSKQAVSIGASFSGLEYSRALESGADPDTAFNTMLMNIPIHSLEQLPILNATKKLDKATGGTFKQILKEGFKGGLYEGAQEVGVEFGSNLIAKNMYDDTIELTEGLKDSGEVGFVLGMAMTGMGVPLRRMRDNPDSTPHEKAEAQKTLEFIQTELQRLPEDVKNELPNALPGEAPRTRNDVDEFIEKFTEQETETEIGTTQEFLESVPDAEEVQKEINKKEQKSEDVSPEQSTNLISPQPDTFGGRIMKKMEQWLAPRGLFPKELREFFRTRPADVKAETRKMQRTIRDLNKKLKDEFDIGKLENAMFSNKIPQELQDDMRRVLTGEAKPDVLPEGIAESVSAMRTHIDRLSRSLIKNGVAEGDLEITFRKNMGYYVHRTYKVHSVDNWSDIVPQDVKNRAKAFLRSQNPDASEAQIKNAINRLLRKENDPVSAFREGKIGSMDLSPLKKRQDIPAPIRELLGEETNVVVNYGKSVIKMANLLENHKTLTALRDKYEGKYFFKLDDDNIPEDATEQLAGDQSDVMGPLSGMWTSPEIKEAFEDASNSFRDMSKWHRGILRLNAGAKFAKTILNPVTVGRNVVGGTGFLIASGNIPSKEHFKKGLQAAKDVFSNPDSKEAREAIDELIRLNITGLSAKAGEVNELLNELTLEDNLDSTFEKLMGGKGLSTKAKRLVKMAGDFYQAGDDFLRIAMYYSNLQRYKEADPNITKEEVARITNDTYQNYDEAGNSKFVTAMRRNPLVAPFLPFTYEVIRTTMNNYKLMKREIGSDNKKMRRIGYSRLAGLSVATGVGSVAAGVASKAILGITDEEDKDIRRHSAPWDKTGTLLHADVDKSKGQATYFNLSYIDPYEYLKDPLLSLIVNDSEEEFMDQLGISMKEMFEPILGPELFAQKAWEWTNNELSSGGRVYNPQAGLGQKTIDTMAHFWDAFEPGFLDWGGKVVDASTNYRSDHSVSGQIASLFGFRPVTIDFEKSLEFKVNDFVQARRDAKRIYTSTLYDEQAGVIEEERSRQEANVAFQDDWESLSRDIEAARRMGVGVHKIKDVLENKNISQDDIRSLLYGSYQEFERDFETGR